MPGPREVMSVCEETVHLTQLMSVPGGRCGVKIEMYCKFSSGARVSWTMPRGQTWTSPCFTGCHSPLISSSPRPPTMMTTSSDDGMEMSADLGALHGGADHHLGARAIVDDLAVHALLGQLAFRVKPGEIEQNGLVGRRVDQAFEFLRVESHLQTSMG